MDVYNKHNKQITKIPGSIKKERIKVFSRAHHWITEFSRVSRISGIAGIAGIVSGIYTKSSSTIFYSKSHAYKFFKKFFYAGNVHCC